jgi:hypothetical protein
MFGVTEAGHVQDFRNGAKGGVTDRLQHKWLQTGLFTHCAETAHSALLHV